MQQEQPEDDDLMIPLNVASRLAQFTDRYFVKSYTENQFVFQHSNRLFMTGISYQHPIVLSDSPIKRIEFMQKEQQVKGKKKKGGLKVKSDTILLVVHMEQEKYEITAGKDGYILEMNENLQRNAQLLKEYPERNEYIKNNIFNELATARQGYVSLLNKDELALLQKPWVKNHTTLTNDHILELFRLFNLFCDPRTRRIDLKDVMITAQQLGLIEKSPIVAGTLQAVSDEHGDGGVDFEEFVRELTTKLGNTFEQKGREQLFTLVDVDGKGTLDKDDLRKISDELHLNFSQKDIDEIVHNVAGYDAEDITREQFEKYLAKLTQRRKIETEVLRTK